MSKQKIDIGSLYRKAFEQYAPSPPESVWKGIDEGLPKGSASPGISGLIKPALWTAAAAVVVISGILLLNDMDEEPQIVMNESIVLDKNQTSDVPVLPEPGNTILEEENSGPAGETGEAAISKPESNPVKEKERPQNTNTTAEKDQEQKQNQETTKESPEQKIQEKPAKDEALSKPEPESAWERHRISRGSRERTTSAKVSYSPEQTICKGESVKIGASKGAAYEWANGSTMDSITVSPEFTQVYDLTILRTDNRKVEASIRVNVRECATLFIPNAFTPNNDGKNDLFEVGGTNIESYRIIIQSVEGTLMFESDDINESWDGIYLGEYVEPGTYLYHIDYIDTYGNVEERNGRITVIR